MATMLDVTGDEELEPLFSINPSTGLFEQHPIKEPTMGDPAPTPQKILVREIGLDPTAADGPFVFVNPDEPRTYTAGTLDTILDRLRQGIYTRTTPVGPYERPLDLKCGAITQFVFYLSPLGNGRRWRFSSESRGVTLGYTTEAERANYYSLRHVLDDSVGTPNPHPHTSDCRIVTFIAKNMSEDFRHPFNLNIEFVYPDHEGKTNTLPIMIDPDIRYPGGSG